MKSIRDYSQSGVKERIGELFPFVKTRIETYERDCIAVSKSTNIPLELSFDSYKENVSLYVETTFAARNMTKEAILGGIERAVASMKEATSRIDSFTISKTESSHQRPRKATP